MRDELFREILMARQRVYAVSEPTPLERLDLDIGAEVFLKREDLSPIHAYKWRGAYNRMAVLSEAERDRGVVAASAGNHAQGVALAARKLGVRARIFMPLSTPKMKQAETRRHGGAMTDIVLHGDTYDEAAEQAGAAAREEGLTFIHPYDDLITMGGQGTLADEAVMSGLGPVRRRVCADWGRRSCGVGRVLVEELLSAASGRWCRRGRSGVDGGGDGERPPGPAGRT
jgi:threonine dehydratase